MSDDEEFENTFFDEVEHFSSGQSNYGNKNFDIELSSLNFVQNNQQTCNKTTNEFDQEEFKGQSSTSMFNNYCEQIEIEYDWRYPC
ncbi:hypothetical protein KUTeg_006045 [Tegillarca granosa]|uniref:Uncharacterized protein n=1 Tax=Tegillarca granosa TaxID=220873 RepID=A0ABQ9FIN3_TEGGR|nr:hypothetical protein KUTeg_006045 [Tegillarca granosa]